MRIYDNGIDKLPQTNYTLAICVRIWQDVCVSAYLLCLSIFGIHVLSCAVNNNCSCSLSNHCSWMILTSVGVTPGAEMNHLWSKTTLKVKIITSTTSTIGTKKMHAINTNVHGWLDLLKSYPTKLCQIKLVDPGKIDHRWQQWGQIKTGNRIPIWRPFVLRNRK